MRTALRIFWQEFRKKYQRGFTIAVAIIAIGLWIAVPFVSQISFELATGISLACLVVILGMVLDHLVAIRELRVAMFYPDQSTAENDTLELIEKEKVQLIEYSSGTITRILQKLRAAGAEIELLICNPHYTITNEKERSFHSSEPGNEDFQKNKRVCITIGELRRKILGDYDNVKIKCYRIPGSFRGRKFGNRWIQVGWYTYQNKKDPALYSSPQIWGDINPVITVPIATPEGKILQDMFNQLFKHLWSESVPLVEVCGNCSQKAACFGAGTAADKWLRMVSSLEGDTKDESRES